MDTAIPNAHTAQSEAFLRLIHGAPEDLKIVQRAATQHNVRILRDDANGNVHVRLSDGRCGFFSPGGPAPKTYIWFKAAASNYLQQGE